MNIEELSKFILGCEISQIRENVILAPCWSPQSIGITIAKKLSTSTPEIWDCEISGEQFTYIVSGVGAFSSADIIRALKITKCKKILVCGSAGALDPIINIGDIAIPYQTMCGEGASRYHQNCLDQDLFGNTYTINSQLFNAIVNTAEAECIKLGISLHTGTSISVESIFAQFSHLDYFEHHNCTFIDMEASACNYAAITSSIPLCVIFCISDNVKNNESLVTVSSEKTNYRKKIRKVLLPQIIIAFLKEEVSN